MNEVYAFHGTFVRYALSIAENEPLLQLVSRPTQSSRHTQLGRSNNKSKHQRATCKTNPSRLGLP